MREVGTFQQEIDRMHVVISGLEEITKTLDKEMPTIREAGEIAQRITSRLKTSRIVNTEALRIGRESGYSKIEGCLKIQALIEACEYQEDKDAARAFFGLGVVQSA